MATVFNDLPGVRRKEVDLSDNLVPRIGNTVGTVIRSYKGAIKRPILVTSQKDFVTEFGAPVFTSGSSASEVYQVGGQKVTVPDYGYGAYAVLNVLSETSSVIVVRGYDTTGGDKYAETEFLALAPTSAAVYGTSAFAGSGSGFVPTLYTPGDPFDTPKAISTVDVSSATWVNTYDNSFVVSHTAPSTFGNDIAITVELPSLSADWLYAYDGYPALPTGVSAMNVWASATSAAAYFPIASNMIKVSVFVKPSNKTWDDLYTNTTDKTAGKLRIQPAEVFYGTTYDVADSNQNSLFIEDVVNGVSKFIYIKANKNNDSTTPTIITYSGTDQFYKALYGKDNTGSFYVYRNALLSLSGGKSKIGSGINNSADQSLWNIFQNRKQISVDILLNTSWHKADKMATSQIVASRLDCFAELQSNPPLAYTASGIIENEQYGYMAPSYVGLSVGFSSVLDTYNNKNIWLPNAIFETMIDLRSVRMTNPWTAPAGTNRGIVPVNAQLMTYSDPELDLIIGRNLNPISLERGYGFVVWSQRTAQLKKSALDRKNVRFSLLYIENNIEVLLKQFVFENNTAQNRQRCYDGVYEFLDNVKASGGLYGFDVVCDETNNPPSVIDANEMNVDIYLKPVKTAEIINFTTVIVKTGAAFNTVRLQYV